MKQKRVFLISGLPGSGKSTWVKNRIAEKGGIHISRDKIRFAMLDNQDAYFQREDEVFTEFCRQAQRAINDDNVKDVYIDATHLSNGSRRKIMNHLYISNAEKICVSFVVPMEICLNRNAKRSGLALVPEDVIKNMANSFSVPASGGMFDKVWTVNCDGKVVNKK